MKLFSPKQLKEYYKEIYKKTGLVHSSIVEVKPLDPPSNMIFYLDYKLNIKK